MSEIKYNGWTLEELEKDLERIVSWESYLWSSNTVKALVTCIQKHKKTLESIAALGSKECEILGDVASLLASAIVLANQSLSGLETNDE